MISCDSRIRASTSEPTVSHSTSCAWETIARVLRSSREAGTKYEARRWRRATDLPMYSTSSSASRKM